MRRQLGAFETAGIITSENEVFNVVVVLRITHGPPPETLRRALDILQKRHPLAGVHIQKEKSRYFFVSDGTPSIPLVTTPRTHPEHWRRVTEDELNTGIDLFTGPLLRCTYLTADGDGSERHGAADIIFTFQHSIMDGDSGIHFLHQMLDLCRQSANGQAMTESVSDEPLPPVDAFYPPKFKGLGKRLRMAGFLLRQMADEFMWRLRSRGCPPPTIHPSGRAYILPVRMSKALSDAVVKRSRRRRVTLNSIFNAAMLLAVRKHLYGGRSVPLRQFSFANLRPYVKPPLGIYDLLMAISMMRLTIPMKADQSVWELADVINRLTYRAARRGDKFITNLFSHHMMKAVFRFKAFRMGVTALSYTGPGKVEPRYGSTEIQALHAFVSNFPVGPEYTTQIRLFGGEFWWDIVYLDSDMDAAKARAVADDIMTILEEAVRGDAAVEKASS